jgi:hypothetical protein
MRCAVLCCAVLSVLWHGTIAERMDVTHHQWFTQAEKLLSHLLKQGNHPLAKCKAPSTVQRQPTSKEVQSTTTQISCLHAPGSILLPKTTTKIRQSCKIPLLLTKTSALPTRPRCLQQDLTPGQQSIWGTCSIAVKSSDQLHLVR